MLEARNIAETTEERVAKKLLIASYNRVLPRQVKIHLKARFFLRIIYFRQNCR